MPEMIYEQINALTRDEIAAAVERNDTAELRTVVLSVAMYDRDQEFAESFCLGLAHHPHFNVRGNAVLGFGHIARVHGKLSEEKIKPVIRKALLDEEFFVRSQAESAKDDTEWFLKWEF